MSIASRIEAIEQHLTDDYSVLTLAGADLTSVNKNILNLKPTWKERLLYFMNNGTQVVWNNWNKVSGTGTSLTLNNTEEAPMSLTYKGNTSQSGTPTPSSPIPVQVVSGDNSIKVEGKNLLTLTDKEQTTHANGITYKVENNVFTLSGTNTSSSAYSLTAWIEGQVQTYLNKILEKGKTFTLSSNNDLAGLYFQINYFKEGSTGQSALVNLGNFNSKITFTVPQDFNRTGNVFLGVYGNATTINGSFSLQLEYGNNKTDFVPYQTPASYPISLGVENLFDISKVLTNGTNIINNGNGTLSVKAYGTAGGAPSSLKTYCPNLKVGDIVTFSFETTSTNKFIYLSGAGANFSWQSGTSQTITKAMLDSSVLWYSNNSTTTDTISNIQVEKGTKANSYTPYGVQPIELCKIGTYQDKIDKSSGKNLFDGEIEEGTISVSNGQNASSTTKLRSVNYIPVNPETTYYRLFNTTSSDGYLYYYDKNKTLLSTLWYNASTNGTFTTPANCYYLRFITPLNSNPLYMISLGNEVPVYEPYGTDWYLKKEIGKVVLNENSNIVKYTGTDIGRYYISGITGLKGSASSPNAMSNYFNSAFSTSNGSIFVSDADGSINMINTAYNNDLAGFKTWLGTTTPSVYYVLSTPAYETITDTTLISQLEALKKSYENVTNISQVNNDLPFELDVTALEEMN